MSPSSVIGENVGGFTAGATVERVVDAVIESPANQRVKDLVALQTRRRTRDELGLVVVEGHDEVALAVEGGARIQTLYHCPGLQRGPDAALVARIRAAGAEVVELGRRAFARAAYRQSPDGWMVVARAPDRPLDRFDPGPDPLLLVCEAVEKPGNLGAMLRTADAAGVDGCVSLSPGTDWANPNVVRASRATVFTVPVITATTDGWRCWAADRGVRVVAATPAASVDLTDADLTGPLAVVVGAERVGLSEALLASAAERVRIPMVGRVNSLNVAMSAGLILYEARRQRGWPAQPIWSPAMLDET